MDKLLNLEYNQEIVIENITYTVIAMLKFSEGSSYWIEYILRKNDDNKILYLDIEPVRKMRIVHYN